MTARDLFTPPLAPSSREVLSVTELNRKARQLLETHFALLWVEGEISNLSTPSSGHWYFTLKDADAQVRCAMFRNRNSLLRFKPAHGKQVVVRARVSLYEGRGDYQLIVEHMEEAGFGVLQRAFEALKAKLGAEGLFDAAHKKSLPTLPRHIAVITSPSGAAIHDVLTVLKRRFAAIPVTVIPVAVQGTGAAAQIVRAIEIANRASDFDVILLCRGGGSLEDLWPFNEEIVARAVFASRLPIVCAVGHEVDFSIADFVADARAPTPSVAAEMLSPDGKEWLQTFVGYEVLLRQIQQRQLRGLLQQVGALRARLRHPGERLQHCAQRLDHLELRMKRALTHRLHRQQAHFLGLAARLQHKRPAVAIRDHHQRVQSLHHRLQHCMRQHLRRQHERSARAIALLDSVSPLATLRRGYSVVLTSTGSIVRNSDEVKIGDQVTAKLGSGELLCEVKDRRSHYARIDRAFDTSPRISDGGSADD